MFARGWLTLALICLVLPSSIARGQAVDDGRTLSIRYSLKNSALLTRDDATGFWRVRVEPTIRWNDALSFDAAFEQRVRVFSSTTTLAAANVLPSDIDAPYRVRQLDWRFGSTEHSEWRGEVDRAALHVHASRADVTVGRQAIGWGRGVLFSAVDLFSPFTPLEADREWRRGVDAVRGDVKITDRVSVDTVAAFDRTLRQSALATRLRGYAGRIDVEVLGGYRARDLFAGGTSSAAVGDAELHGEIALFRDPDRHLTAKAVAGGSYRIAFGNGVLVYGEYHYSGFGDSIERYLRGDTQILGRHALAGVATYEFSPELVLGGNWIQNPVNGSGVVAPSATWTLSDRWSVLFTVYAAYGGEYPTAAFIQLRLYR